MENQSILEAVVALALIIAFFIIAFKISKIHDILTFFMEVELRKPENWYEIKCEKCGKEFKVSKASKGSASCTHCKSLNRLPE